MAAGKERKVEVAPTFGRKGDRTKEALRQSARAVFGRLGYANARVIDITDNAGMSLGAFYRYFDDKDAVLRELLDAHFSEYYSTTFHGTHYDSVNPATSVYKGVSQTLKFVAENVDMMKVVWEVSQTSEEVEDRWNAMRDRVIKRVAKSIERAQVDGVAYPELDGTAAAETLVGMLENVAYRKLVRGTTCKKSAIEDLARHVSMIWTNALFVSPAAPGGLIETGRGKKSREAIGSEDSPVKEATVGG
jgi:AcrR family transcriptional regulator